MIVGRLVPRRLLSTGQAVTQTFGWSIGAIVGPVGRRVRLRPPRRAGAVRRRSAALCLGGALWVWLALAGTEQA